MRYIQDLPADLIPLVEKVAELATDLHWTWSHGGDAVWEMIDPQLWEQRDTSVSE